MPAPAPTPDRLAEAAALALHRDAARALEEKEEWAAALAEYEAALAVDPHVTFALEGKQKATGRAALSDGLDFHARNPARLSTEGVAREAEALLERARGVAPAGPRLRAQVAAVEKALADARTPVAVVIESDGLTEVAVSRIGRLGTLTRRSVDLRPGEYTATGSRRGYRDVRRKFTVEPRRTGGADRRALRGGSLTTIRVEDGGRSRALGAADFPVPLGGAGSPVQVAGSGGPLAWLGLADGEVFVQPSPGASVVCNGTRLSASHWLRDGDALRLGPTRVEVSVRADGMRLVVLAAGRGEPDRAARRARPPASRRAALARGRGARRAHPADRLHAAALRAARRGPGGPRAAGRSPSRDCCWSRARWPSSCRSWPRSALRSHPSPTRWRCAAAGRSCGSPRASWRCPAPTRSSPRRTATAGSRRRSR